MAIDAYSDVLVPVYFVQLECIERVALLGARFQLLTGNLNELV